MAQKGGNRLQKKAAKAVDRRQAVAAKRQTERLASSLSGRVAAAAGSPIERCLRTADLSGAGIGYVILAKRSPSGALACAFFLVDLLCLGVKDVFFREMPPSDLDERVDAFAADDQILVPIDAASAKALLTGAVAFAAGSGLGPHKDHRAIMRVFDGVNVAASESFDFGRDGRPVYIPGPNDSPAKMRETQRSLTRTRGVEGWTLDLGSHALGLRDLVRDGAMGDDADFDDGGLDGDEPDGGLVIEHEGSTEPRDA